MKRAPFILALLTFAVALTAAVDPVWINRQRSFNIDDYGADNTGVADSLPAINRVISGLACAGLYQGCDGAVEFGRGKYCVSQPIVMTGKHGLVLRGRGKLATTIVPCAGSSMDFPLILDAGTHASQTGNISVERMGLQCGGKSYLSSQGISFANTSYGTIDEVWVAGCKKSIYLRNVWQIDLKHVNMHGGGTLQNGTCLWADMPAYGATASAGTIAGTTFTAAGSITGQFYVGGTISWAGGSTQLISQLSSTQFVTAAPYTVAATAFTEGYEDFWNAGASAYDPFNNAFNSYGTICKEESDYAARLINANGSKSTSDQWMNGTTGVYYCDPPIPAAFGSNFPYGGGHTPSPYACSFMFFNQSQVDTTTAIDWNFTRGLASTMGEGVVCMQCWAGLTGLSGNNGLSFAIDGAQYMQIIDATVDTTSIAAQMNNSTDNFFSAHVINYNKLNNGSAAVLMTNTTARNKVVLHSSRPYSGASVVGYNGFSETGSYTQNQVWAGLASCGIGLDLGGLTTGMTFAAGPATANQCSYEVNGLTVRLQFYLQLSAKGSATGAARLTGLPMLSGPSLYGYGANGTVLASSVAGLSGPVFYAISPGSQVASLAQQGATGTTNVTDANVTNTTVFDGAISYQKQ